MNSKSLKMIGAAACFGICLVILTTASSIARPRIPTGLGPDIAVVCPDGHTAFYNPGWGPGHNTAASAIAICTTWHSGAPGSHQATAGQYRPPWAIPVRGVVKSQAVKAKVKQEEPTGCNPNNLPGNLNPC